MCKQYLWRRNIAKKTPVPFTDAGRWWGGNPKKRMECEIDIIAGNEEDAIFAECKWTNEPVGLDVLETLVEKSELFHYGNKYYFLFAKTGYTEPLITKASLMDNLTLVRFDEF